MQSIIRKSHPIDPNFLAVFDEDKESFITCDKKGIITIWTHFMENEPCQFQFRFVPKLLCPVIDKLLVLENSEKIVLFDQNSLRIKKTFNFDKSIFKTFKSSINGSVFTIASSKSKTICIIYTLNSKFVCFDGYFNDCLNISNDSNGEFIAVQNDLNQISIIGVKNKPIIRKLVFNDIQVCDFKWHRNGEFFMVVSKSNIILYENKTWFRKFFLYLTEFEMDTFKSIKFTPNGLYIFLLSEKNKFLIYDFVTLRHLKTINLNTISSIKSFIVFENRIIYTTDKCEFGKVTFELKGYLNDVFLEKWLVKYFKNHD